MGGGGEYFQQSFIRRGSAPFWSGNGCVLPFSVGIDFCHFDMKMERFSLPIFKPNGWV